VHRDRFSDKRTFPARITSLPVNARAVDFVSAQRQIAAKGANDAPPAASAFSKINLKGHRCCLNLARR
jgi:hypothetical protein